MSWFYAYLSIFLYILFLVVSYILIIKRLKYLNEWHINYTKVECLASTYNSLKKIIFLLFVILWLISLFVIFNFI